MFLEKLKFKKIEFFFLALVLYLPFQIALNLTTSFDLLSGRIFIPGLFLFWWFGQKPVKKFSWLKDEAVLALALFFLINFLSIFWAQNWLWAGRKFLVFASVFPLFALTKEIVSSAEKKKKLINIMTWGAVISSLIALGQFLSQFMFGFGQFFSFWSQKILPWFSGRTFGNLVAQNPSWLVEINGKILLRAFGLFPDPHMLAFFLGLTSFFALAGFLLGEKRRFFWFLFFCFFSLILTLTFSRGGYLGFLAGFLAVIFFAWPKMPVAGRNFLKTGALVFLILVFLAGGAVAIRFFSSFNLNEGSNLGRLAIWQEAGNVFWENPFWGVGLGNYSLAVSPYIEYRNSVTSHNLYLDILAETGIFGLAAWLWFLFAALKATFLKIKSAQKENLIVGWGCLGALVYFLVHSFFETAIFNPLVLAFLMIVCGLAVAKNDKSIGGTRLMIEKTS